MKRSPHSDWMMDSIWLRCSRGLFEDESYQNRWIALNERTRDKWQPDEKVLYHLTLEQERRLSASRSLIKSIFRGLDPGTAGDATEEHWAEVLRALLPQYPIVVKGVIGGIGPRISPQIDIMILDKNYPKHLLSTKVYSIESIVAAFECKLSLRLEDIRDAVSTAQLLNSGNLHSTKDPFSDVPVFYGLLSLSTDIENKIKPAYMSVLDALAKHSLTAKKSFSMVDSIVSIDSFCLTGTRTIECYDADDHPMDMTFSRVYDLHDPEEPRPADSHLGLFIQKLLAHLEKIDSSLGNTRKMYDLFIRYPLDEKHITTEDLSGLVSEECIKAIASGHYADKNTVFSIII